jgi:hypothetical protein
MTDDANPEPGWYWIRSSDSDAEFPIRLQEEGYWCLPGRLDRWLPPSWRIVARIDDLLREAARYRWRDISETPTEPGMVEYYHANWPPEVDCPDSPFRDERRDIGHFDGQHFREKGTDHEVFESWKKPWMLPTHWRYLPPAPDDAEIAREKGP